MAKQYQPYAPFNVPFKILSSTQKRVNGIVINEYMEQDSIYFCSARAYINSNRNVNDLNSEEDTLVIDSYYIPDLKRNDRIRLLDDDSVWELTLTPENINRRNQYSRFKVVKIHG